MNFDLVIKGGRLVRSSGIETANIGILDGVVRAVAQPSEILESRDTLDVAGKLLLPGLIDAHVHIPGFVLSKHLDNFTTASQAAAAGGITTVLLMPTDDPRTATPRYFRQKVERGEGASLVDFAVQAMVSPATQSLRDLADLGAVSYEIFLSYGGNPKFMIGADDYELARTLRLVRDVDGIAGITPHSPSLNNRLTEERRKDAEPTVRTIAATRPVLSEALGVSRSCTAALETGTKLHIRAVSTRSTLQLLSLFKPLLQLTSEVMIHHLLFDDNDAARMGAFGVITPPLRSNEDRGSLLAAVRAGEIDMVVSDHSPALRADKKKGQRNIWEAPPGMTGLQTLCLSMLALVDKGELGLTDLVATCCEGPARAFGLFPRKGTIAVGSDGDIVVIDPSRTTLVRDEDQYSRANYTTLAGSRVNGVLERVLLRGKTIYHAGTFASRPSGQFMRATS
jgi:dihydroorotase